MIVAELIAELEKLPQDALVIAIPSSCCGCSPDDDITVTFKNGIVVIDGSLQERNPPPSPERITRIV